MSQCVTWQYGIRESHLLFLIFSII
jgi:hypothetical protein